MPDVWPRELRAAPAAGIEAKLNDRRALIGAPCPAGQLVSPSGQDMGIVDSWLSLPGRSRSVVAVVNRFADALRIVADSDLLVCVPSDLLYGHARKLMVKNRLVTRDLPFEVEKLLYKLVWHERLHAHPAHQWFRSLVAEVCGAAVSDR
jgi:DNA-binding transcriptional LysR family regulator